jgi:uncharacterized protein (TIGR02996 family)
MFVRGLAVDEDDEPLRLSYADWLDEQGENDEAERQRAWKAAKVWIFTLCCEAAQEDDPYTDWPENCAASYQSLMASARAAADRGFDRVACGNRLELASALRANNVQFWRNWSIVTGIPLPPNVAEDATGFSCAC